MAVLLIATTNRGKLAEYSALLSGLNLELMPIDRAGISRVASEDYNSFEENARSKALFYHSLTGLTTLADDSGLEVDALGGEPGVRSSRYAGENASDSDRVNFLLNKLKGIPLERRTARFKCVIAIAAPGGILEMVDGQCDGLISLEPRGENGFGYDPVFYLPDYGRTIAELPPEVKNEVSHRGRAARKAREILARLIEEKH
jgi:XTP/dITP diphosphohydrolase